MKILIAAPEAMPYIKTGGLADVVGAVFREYRKMNMEASLILPLYRSIRENFNLTDTGPGMNFRTENRSFSGRIFSHDSSVFFLECDEFFDRADLYGTPKGDYPDNASRFAFFDRAVMEACGVLGLKPDIIHCNDWQTGLIPLYLKTIYNNEFFSETASLMTIHNLGYQGLFDVSDFPVTGLGWDLFNPEGIEFYGKVNFLKAGLIASDIITTVSNTYAKEILTDEFGFGLDGVLRKRSYDLYGVINGIDTEEWNPLKDKFIPENYNSSDLSGKAKCRKDLMRECSLHIKHTEDRNSPIIAFIGRLSAQKGIDIFLDAVKDIIAMGARIIILGKGDELFHRRIRTVAENYKGEMFARIGYDEAFAHRIYSGSDIFLMPSRYEPCGLGQLIAMRYGTIPVARMTGGLADSITDYEPQKTSGTGFLFKDYKASSLLECLKRAIYLYHDEKRWKKMIINAMGRDFSWRNSAEKYLKLYDDAADKKRHKGMI